MDRYEPPSLIPPIIASFLAAMCFTLARVERFPDEMRALFVLLGALAAIAAAATGFNWLMYRGAIWLEDIKSAWNAPVLRLAEAVQSMNHEQLALMGMISPVQWEGRMAGGSKVQYWLHTPLVDIPYGWISEYLDACELSYPALPPQHGRPDALNRDYIRGFTGLMVDNGLAEQWRGNKAAQWKIPLKDVADRLGMGA